MNLFQTLIKQQSTHTSGLGTDSEV